MNCYNHPEPSEILQFQKIEDDNEEGYAESIKIIPLRGL